MEHLSTDEVSAATATSSSVGFAEVKTRRPPRMRRTTLLVTALATVLVMVTPPGAASAGDRNVAVACNGFSPQAPPAAVTRPGGETVWGWVYLCWNGVDNFAQFIRVDAYGDQAPMPTNFIANAWVWRYENYPEGFSGKSSCDGPSGNGHVVPGEIWCRSHGLGDTSTSTMFRASAHVEQWSAQQAKWILVASGWVDPAE